MAVSESVFCLIVSPEINDFYIADINSNHSHIGDKLVKLGVDNIELLTDRKVGKTTTKTAKKVCLSNLGW